MNDHDKLPLRRLEEAIQQLFADRRPEFLEALGVPPDVARNPDIQPELHFAGVFTYRAPSGDHHWYLCGCGVITPVAEGARAVQCAGCGLDALIPRIP